jgi:GTP diphosphokinase / guanosine-3',5'-bis(diphosphate) 3'-diphosphatase
MGILPYFSTVSPSGQAGLGFMTHKVLSAGSRWFDPWLVATLEKAIEIAAVAHTGQTDKAGQPYILHPLRVMLRVHTEEEMITAVLHDVVEDTTVTLQDLRREGFSDRVVAAVEALTKRKGENRLEAAKRAAADAIARVVKLADNAENMDLSRIPNPTEKDLRRLDQYAEVRKLLEAAV